MFTSYKASLDPATMSAALKSFELAWAEVMARPTDYDVPATRGMLAKRIIDAALENGERDPEKMKDFVLAEMNPRRSA